MKFKSLPFDIQIGQSSAFYIRLTNRNIRILKIFTKFRYYVK